MPIVDPINLAKGKWAIVYPGKNKDVVSDLLDGMEKASLKLKINVEKPAHIEVSGDNKSSKKYIEKMKPLEKKLRKV